jgi:hypothetical protein
MTNYNFIFIRKHSKANMWNMKEHFPNKVTTDKYWTFNVIFLLRKLTVWIKHMLNKYISVSWHLNTFLLWDTD